MCCREAAACCNAQGNRKAGWPPQHYEEACFSSSFCWSMQRFAAFQADPPCPYQEFACIASDSSGARQLASEVPPRDCQQGLCLAGQPAAWHTTINCPPRAARLHLARASPTNPSQHSSSPTLRQPACAYWCGKRQPSACAGPQPSSPTFLQSHALLQRLNFQQQPWPCHNWKTPFARSWAFIKPGCEPPQAPSMARCQSDSYGRADGLQPGVQPKVRRSCRAFVAIALRCFSTSASFQGVP